MSFLDLKIESLFCMMHERGRNYEKNYDGVRWHSPFTTLDT